MNYLRTQLSSLDVDKRGRVQQYGISVFAFVTCSAVTAGALLARSLLRRRYLLRDSVHAPGALETPLQFFEGCIAPHQRKEAAKLEAAANKARAAGDEKAVAAIVNDPDDLEIRPPIKADAEQIVNQTVEAFNKFNASVALPDEFPVMQIAIDMVDHDTEYTNGFIGVRKSDGVVMGSVFNHEFDIDNGAVGCGPWSTRWGSQQKGVGRRLIEHVCGSSLRRGARSLRLNQICANLTACSLYTSLGFESREPLHLISGFMRPEYLQAEIASNNEGWSVRQMVEKDLFRCDQMHQEACGVSRYQTIFHDFKDKEVKWVLLDKRGNIIAFITGMHVMCMSMATSERAMRFLYAHAFLNHAARQTWAPEVHICSRLYPGLERWLLIGGMKLIRAVNLMVLGEWQPINHEEYVYNPTIMY